MSRDVLHESVSRTRFPLEAESNEESVRRARFRLGIGRFFYVGSVLKFYSLCNTLAKLNCRIYREDIGSEDAELTDRYYIGYSEASNRVYLTYYIALQDANVQKETSFFFSV